jgi:hypothetical protein
VSQPERERQRPGIWLASWVTLLLAAGASALGAWLFMALGPEDIEALESPLVLPVARQLERGPWNLYGPYGGSNPLVLIHAPLYYHLAALAAWPLARFGLDSVTAGLAAGRALSGFGLVLTLIAVYHLARLQGEHRRAGWWAALLAAATPIYGGLPFEVRPDMFGVGLQTTAICLVLKSLGTDRPPEIGIALAFACFGLAASVKQLFVVAPALSAGLLLAAASNGRLRFAALARSLALAAAVVAFVYGFEDWATAGRMSQAIVNAALNVNRVHPAGWPFVGNLFLALAWKCAGVISLWAAAAIAILAIQPSPGRRALAGAGSALLVMIVALEAVQVYFAHMAVSAGIVIGVLLLMLLLVPCSVVWERRSVFGGRVDRALWLYLIGELTFVALLSRQSTGAWYNYAIEAVVIGAALTARALSRAFSTALRARQLVPAAVAALAVPLFAFTDVKEVVAKRQAEHELVNHLLAQIRRSPAEMFFVDRPGDNRVHGQSALVYDPWLYPVFESIGLAEPRSIWLARALATGPVRVVIGTGPSDRIDGVRERLPELGYRPSFRLGPFLVWER